MLRASTMLCHRLALELVCKRSRHLAKRFSYILHREVLLTVDCQWTGAAPALSPACLGWLRAHASDIVTLRVETDVLVGGLDTVAAAVRCLLRRSAQLQGVHFPVDLGMQRLNLLYQKEVWPADLERMDRDFKSELVLASTCHFLTGACAAWRVCQDQSSRRRWQRAICRLCDLLRWVFDL